MAPLLRIFYVRSMRSHQCSIFFHYSSVSNTRPVANKIPGWVLEGLYEHFLFATGFILRDRAVTGGEGGQPSMRGQQHKE